MISILLIIIPLLSQHQVFSSPVLLWSNARDLPQSAVPLSTLSSLDVVSNYICKLDGEQIEIRLFAVDELKNEDIQRGSQNNHPLLLDAKNEKSQFRYIPDVANDVYKTFSLIPQSNNMYCSHIHFQIASSDIYPTLEEALNAMQTVVNSIETDSKIVTVMALISRPVVDQSLTRRRRDIMADKHDVLISNDTKCMFYAEKFYWNDAYKKADGNFSTLALNQSSCTPTSVVVNNNNYTAVVLNLTWINGLPGTFTMTLTAYLTGRYWFYYSAVINDSEYRYFAYGMNSKMDTPANYSYVCTSAYFVKYDSKPKHGAYDFHSHFHITHLQFQPFFANGSIFGPPNYCTSFFTSGIWMGITSSLLCLGILLVGVTRMMNIKSNDRFDDPKGKPLIIKAQE